MTGLEASSLVVVNSSCNGAVGRDSSCVIDSNMGELSGLENRFVQQ